VGDARGHNADRGYTVTKSVWARRGAACLVLAASVSALTATFAIPTVAAHTVLARNATSGSSAWNSPQAEALTAISTYAGNAPTGIGSLSPEVDSSLTTESGQALSVQERSFDASIGGVPSQVTLTWLNQTQVIADYVTFGSQFESTSLVLQPGTANINGAYQEPAEGLVLPTTGIANVTGNHAPEDINSTLIADRVSSRSSRHHLANSARLSGFIYAGGCEEYLDAPATEVTGFGVLVYGISGFVNDSCNGNQDVEVGLEFETTNLNDLAGASGNPANGGFGAIAYWPCYGVTSFFPWYTNTAYDVFGSLYGYTDGPSFLYCVDGY